MGCQNLEVETPAKTIGDWVSATGAVMDKLQSLRDCGCSRGHFFSTRFKVPGLLLVDYRVKNYHPPLFTLKYHRHRRHHQSIAFGLVIPKVDTVPSLSLSPSSV